jgi:hypothetical protein
MDEKQKKKRSELLVRLEELNKFVTVNENKIKEAINEIKEAETQLNELI